MLLSALVVKNAKDKSMKSLQSVQNNPNIYMTVEMKQAYAISIVELIFFVLALIISWNCAKANKDDGFLVIVNWICAFLFPIPYVIISLLVSQCARDTFFKSAKGPSFYSFYGDSDYDDYGYYPKADDVWSSPYSDSSYVD
jgi:hypothetical protein